MCMVRATPALLERVPQVQGATVTARTAFVLVACIVGVVFVWWLYSLLERSELVADEAETVEVVAIEGVPSTITVPTTTTTVPPTTTTAVARTAPTVRTASASRPIPAAVYGAGACGGDLPPCWVMKRESGGNIRAVNPTGCGGRGCYGKWQFDPRTWANFGGFAYASDAPESVQDEKARQLWAGGRGCSHWAAC